MGWVVHAWVPSITATTSVLDGSSLRPEMNNEEGGAWRTQSTFVV